MVQPETIHFDDDGAIPNSRLPLLLYRAAVPADAAAIEALFAANRWPPARRPAERFANAGGNAHDNRRWHALGDVRHGPAGDPIGEGRTGVRRAGWAPGAAPTTRRRYGCTRATRHRAALSKRTKCGCGMRLARSYCRCGSPMRCRPEQWLRRRGHGWRPAGPTRRLARWLRLTRGPICRRGLATMIPQWRSRPPE